MQKYKALILFVLCSSIIAAYIFSLCGESAALTLEEAFETALNNNPMLVEARAGVEESKHAVDEARSYFFPRLDFSGNFSRTNNPPAVFSYKLGQEKFTRQDFAIDSLNDPDPRSNFQSRFILTQPIFNQGKEILGYKAAKVGRKVASLEQRKRVQKVLFDVETAYYQVLLAQEAIKVMEAALKAANGHFMLAKNRYKAGSALKSDMLAASVKAAEMEQGLAKAQGDFQVAMASLNAVMGVDQAREYSLEPPVSVTTLGAEGLEYWLSKARENRPEIKQVKNYIRLAKIDKKGAKLAFAPSLNLHGIYEANTEDLFEADGDSWTIMATLSFNIFKGFGDKARVAKADARLRKTRAMQQGISDKVELEVREAYFGLLTAQKQLEAAKRSVAQARESQTILKNRYENGMALMVELLAADTALKEAELREATARFNVRSAYAKLKWRAGLLDKQGISKNVE